MLALECMGKCTHHKLVGYDRARDSTRVSVLHAGGGQNNGSFWDPYYNKEPYI